MNYKISIKALLVLLLYSSPLIFCQKIKTECILMMGRRPIQKNGVCYAKGFQIETYPNYTLVKIRNPWNKNRVLQTYILISRLKRLPMQIPHGQIVRTPLKKVVCCSSVFCGILDVLGVLQTVKGVTESQYIGLPFIQKGIRDGTIQDIGLSTNPNIEKLIFYSPEGIFMHPINMSSLIKRAKIPVIYCTDYMEPHPLGQSEWIRFIGLLFDKKQFVDSLFFETVHSYNKLKRRTEKVRNRPTVFTEMKYGDIWYMPGGRSYLAQLLKDAGADYVLKNDTNIGSIPASFEFVLSRARKANYWLIKYYSSRSLTYSRLVALYSNYTLFDAFKNKNIYACNTMENTSFYQEMFLYPDKLLKDMIILFHPQWFLNDTSVYYRKL